MVITRRLKLYPPNKKKAKLLEKTALLQSSCVNWWMEKIKETRTTKIKTLQSLFYKKAKKKFKMGAMLTQVAEFRAIRIFRHAIKKNKTPRLKKRLLVLSGLRIKDNNLGITFGQRYFWIPFHSQKIPQGVIKESIIKKIRGNWYCLLCVNIKTPKIKKYKKTLGVDLGLAKIAVVSDNKGKNNVFFKGEPLRAKRRHYYNLRKRLQPKIKQGNVYKLLKRISKKEQNWITNENHRISRQIVNLAKNVKANIALENLKGITERLKFNKKTKRIIKTWSFRQLANFISYKAQMIGLRVSFVDPRETSRRCSKCGYISRYNRRTQSKFKCRKCGYETNADRNGAINIAQRATVLSVNPMNHGQQATALM